MKQGHTFDREIVGKAYCSYCGLLKLNNKFTQWAIKIGCDNRNHPDYEKKRKEYTNERRILV
jgi:hypothetical protein